MNPWREVPLLVAMGLLGWLGGSLFGRGTLGVVTGIVAGLLLGLAMVATKMRPLVGISIVAGGLTGAWIGRAIVRALCLPGSCPPVEAGAAVLTGLGATVGIGLVVALVVRSFEEYREGPAPAGDDRG